MTRALGDSMVKACLFLLVAVAVAHDAPCAASSPGCSSKMQADATTLLQTGVRIGDELAPGHTDQEVQKHTYTDEATNPHKVSWMQEGMNTQQLKEKLIDNSKGKGRRDVLIQLSRFVNTLGNATKHLNSSNADNLNEVIKILRAVLYKSMNTDHTEDQKELNQAFAGITTCNTDLGKATTDNVTPLKNTMVTARSTHMTCRTEEARLETIKDGKWNEMLGHIAGISKPPSVTTWPVSPTYDTLVPYFSTGYAEWFVRQKQAFDTKNHAYVSANTNWTTSKARCDSDQTTFESDFCVYNAVLDTTCDNHDTCYISASSGANTTTARLEVTEAARKEAYKAGEEIVCRINALLANRAYSECDNLTVDTSNYSIVYPTADAKDSCVNEAEKPCSNTWKDTEYNGLPSNAPSTTCTPCQAPSMAPTVAPTTQPIQAGMCTCDMSIDNDIDFVYIDGVDMTSSVSGDLGNWGQHHTITFACSAATVLAVQGSDGNGGGGGCNGGGFAAKCSSTNPSSPWHNLIADTAWKVFGAECEGSPCRYNHDHKNVVKGAPAGWYLPAFDDAAWAYAIQGNTNYAQSIIGTPFDICSPDGPAWLFRSPKF